jgi:hypothetical protein
MIHSSKKFLLLLLFSFFLAGSFGQLIPDVSDPVYGLDPELFNGKVYTYYLPSSTSGNQYLYSKEFVKGEVNIKGLVYKDIAINYDVFNQVLLLKYKTSTGAESIIEVSNAWLAGFNLGNRKFELIRGPDSLIHYYQVIGDSSARILYSWKKYMKLDNGGSSSHYAFSSPRRDSYIFKDGQFFSYKNKRGFISAFDSSKQAQIKNYIRQHKIRFKKSSDQDMLDLITYCTKI